jgi:hypothetical protein
MGGRRVTTKERRAMVQLRSEGKGYEEMGHLLGRSLSTISRHLQDMGHARFGPLPLSDTVGRVTVSDGGVVGFTNAASIAEVEPPASIAEVETVPDFLRLVHDLVELADTLRGENAQWMAEVERLESENKRLQQGAEAASDGYKELIQRGTNLVDGGARHEG